MYIPTNSINMKDITEPRIILGIQGASGTGKTWSALTFPNPVVADFDSGLTAKRGDNIIAVPFWDDNYCVTVLKMTRHQVGVVNKRDGFTKWLKDEAIKLTSEQTLIVDSWTALQNAFDRMTELEPSYTSAMKVDEFAFWGRKIEYSRDLMETLKGLKCNIVICFHESQKRDPNTGLLLDKILPLMQGGFVSQLPNSFTDFFRQHAIGKLDQKGNPRKVEGKELTKDTEYFWQIKSDNIVNLKTRMRNRPETLIPANYSEFNYGKQH